jgi:hypothetical protein
MESQELELDQDLYNNACQGTTSVGSINNEMSAHLRSMTITIKWRSIVQT